MKNLTATLCLTLAVLLGSIGVSTNAEPIKGYCLSGTKHSDLPIADKCSASYEKGDYELALWEFQFYAKQGFAPAQSNLGLMYYNGKGVSQNYKTAVKWYRRAAEQGYAIAQTNLGYMYDRAIGVPKNYKTALKWYRRGVKQGNASGQHNLGVMYQYGKGVPKNYKTAVKWFRLAAEQGDSPA
ncbi:MAG: hypothetical protein CMM44_06475 [Rhodospirillaceae bacterium]|nr:hypothetical protein [Rhodospirillaceae bacterium]